MADATSRLRLVVDSTGVDKAGRKLKDLRRDARGAEDAAARLKTAFVALGSIVGTIVTRGLLQGFNEQARAMAKVEQAVRSTGAAAGFTANELIKVASNLQKVTRFGDEKILNEVTAQLLTFTNIAQEEFLRTQKVALDLATVLDGDLKSASIQLGKALNDPIANLSALSRSGIQFSQSQKTVIKDLVETGRLAEAQRVILTEIEKQYGGQAEAAAKVGTALLEQLKNIVGDIGEQLGERLFRFLEPAIRGLKEFLSIDENQASVIKTIEGVAAALGTLGIAFASLSALSALPAVIAAIASPLGLLAIAIGSVVAFRDDIAEWAFGVRDAGAVVQAAIEVLRPKFTALYDTIKSVASASLDVLGQFGVAVVDIFKALWETVQQYFGLITEAVNRVQIATKTRELENLVKRQTDLTNKLKANAADPFQDQSLVDGSAIIRKELEQIGSAISQTSNDLNDLLNPQGGFGAITDTFGEIADRAKEIAEAKLADPLIDANDAGQKLLKTTKEISEEARKAAVKLAAGASAAFLDIKVDEKLGLFGGVDLGRLSQRGRDAALSDFENAFDHVSATLAKEVSALAVADKDAARQLNADYLKQLADLYSDFFKRYKDANEEHISGIEQAIRDGVSNLDIAAEGLNIGTEIVDSLTDTIRAFRDGVNKSIENFTRAVGNAAQNLGDALRRGGAFIGGGLGGILGKAGQIAGVVGQAISFGSSIIGFFKSIFGKPSDNAAGGGVNFSTFGVENLFAKGTENIEARDQILAATSQLAKTLATLTGARLTGSGISIQAGSRNGTRIISSAGGDVTTPAGNAEAATAEIFRQLAVSLQGGEKALVDLTKAAAAAKADVDKTVDVLGALSEIAKSGEPPISKYGEALKKLDDLLSQVANSAAVRAEALSLLRKSFDRDINEAIEQIKDPAIAGFRELARNLATVLSDATALGVDTGQGSKVMELIGLQISEFFEQAAQGGEDIVALTARLADLGNVLTELGIDANIAAQALQKALATQRAAFDKQIQEGISQFLTGPIDQLEKLLQDQKKRIDQAKALGADLTQVERLSALELRQFFQGLSDSALDEVRDFLGLFEEAADSVARNLDLSRQDLRAKADQFGQFAQQFASLATDFREKFIAASPRESIDILRGRASELLGQIGQGNESAAQALPQVLNQLVENARQSFGNTKQFQEVLDFALSTLGQAESSALGVQSEAERQIAALDESNDLLTDIRDILQSSAAFNALLQSSVNGGVASSGELLALIQSGAGLTMNPANDNAATLSVTGLIAQSLSPVFTPLVSSIDNFTQSMSQMPYYQRLQIEATDNGTAAIVGAIDNVVSSLDRLETIQKQALIELQQAG